MRVLVCGGRYHANKAAVFQLLDYYHATKPFSVVIQGAAAGADQWAREWAQTRGVPLESYPAQWKNFAVFPCVIRTRRDGRKYNAVAGHQRNTQMLRKGKPDVVIAFSGGKGTRDMVCQAQAADVPVLNVAGHDA